jgi:hypothetical protein
VGLGVERFIAVRGPLPLLSPLLGVREFGIHSIYRLNHRVVSWPCVQLRTCELYHTSRICNRATLEAVDLIVSVVHVVLYVVRVLVAAVFLVTVEEIVTTPRSRNSDLLYIIECC